MGYRALVSGSLGEASGKIIQFPEEEIKQTGLSQIKHSSRGLEPMEPGKKKKKKNPIITTNQNLVQLQISF